MSAERSWPSLALMLDKVDMVHGPYYAVMHVWFSIVGYTPLTLRAPSVVSMAVATSLVFMIGMRLASWRAGIFSAIAFVCLPSVTSMGIEGRMFAPATAAVILAVLLFVEAMRKHRLVWWFAYALAVILATTLHVFSVLVFITLPLAMSLWRASTRQWRAFLISSGLAAAVCLPFLLKVLSQRGQLGGLTPIDLRSVLSAPRNIWLPWPTWGGSPMIIGAWGILIASLALLLLSAARGHRSTPPHLGVAGTLALVLGWLLTPVIFVIGWSVLVSDMFAPRYLIITSPALALVIGLGLNSLRRTAIPTFFLATALGVSIALPWSAQRTPTGKGAQTALVAHEVRSQLRSGDAVLFMAVSGRTTQPRNVKYAYPEAFQGVEDLTLSVPYSQTDWLYDVDVPLADVSERLDDRTRVIAICQVREGAPSDNGDLETLRSEGFSEVSSTGGSDWVVRVYER